MNEGLLAAANAQIERVRKGTLTLRLHKPDGSPLAYTAVKLRQTRSHFLFGTCIDAMYIRDQSPDGQQYRAFITKYFNAGVCENAMKWPSVEPVAGYVTFEDADAIMQFADANGLAMRGHCLFWESAERVQPWVQALSNDDLVAAMERHIGDIVPRYQSRMVGWDVDNEMLDNAFYADRLGGGVRVQMFANARANDPRTPLFTNEYGVVGDDAKTLRYRNLIQQLGDAGAQVGGIGIQAHEAARFAGRSLPVIVDITRPETGIYRDAPPIPGEAFFRRLDTLATFGVPLYFTEVTFDTRDDAGRADALEMFMTLAFSRPEIRLINLWGFWEKAHWRGRDAALVDRDWNLLPAGERLQELLMQRWRTNVQAVTDADGSIVFRGFYGTYNALTDDTLTLPRQATITFTPDVPEITATLSL